MCYTIYRVVCCNYPIHDGGVYALCYGWWSTRIIQEGTNCSMLESTTYRGDCVYWHPSTNILFITLGVLNMNWSELKAKLDSYVLPLHDLNWVKDEIRKGVLTLNDYDLNDPNDKEEYDNDVEYVDTYTGIVLGLRDPEEFEGFPFGLKTEEGWLDDQSIIECITQVHWKELSDLGLVDWRCMESYTEIIYTDHEEVFPELSRAQRFKELESFFSTLLGKSLTAPDAPTMKSTADCKKFISETYGKKVKRTKKQKWGDIEFRLFEDEDGEHVSVVSYNDKLISHYAFPYGEEY